MRKPSVAGQFYEGDEDELRAQISGCFFSDFGPKRLPDGAGKERILGVISPHAGFMYSGPAAAFVYKAIAEVKKAEKPDLFIILGPNHTGIGRTSHMAEDFETPLGIARHDADFARLLSAGGAIVEDKRAHMYEHSIEVQLPFLQFIFDDRFRFVPVVISSEINLGKVAETLKKAIIEYEKAGKKACIIASSDFTHYGPNYGYVPFGKVSHDSVRARLRELDMGAIELIRKFDADSFLMYVKRTGSTICGMLPIYVMVKSLAGRAKAAELLSYYTSGDIIGDYSNSVSYAGMIIR